MPMGTPHQIANRGTEDLVVIEVSVGELEYGHGNDLTRLAGQSIVKTDCDEIVRWSLLLRTICGEVPVCGMSTARNATMMCSGELGVVHT